MPQDVSGADARGTVAASLNSRELSLLEELEESLRQSQKLVLARDVAGLERETQRQATLQRELQGRRLPINRPAKDSSATVPEAFLRRMTEVHTAEVRAIELRLLHLGRVQLALLRRAQRFNAVIGQLIAGPGASYSAPALRLQNLAGAGPEPKVGPGACPPSEEFSACRA